MKKTFQDVLSDIQDNLIGKILHGISGNASEFSVVEVDRVNDNVVLDVMGKRKTWTFERLGKVWNEMYYRPAANVEIVFGGSGSSRNQVETIYASLSYVEWLYVKSKKCVAYVGKDTHPYGELRHMDDDSEEEYQKLMAEPNPRNPLLEPDEIQKQNPEAEKNEYEKAAEELKYYVLEEGFEMPVQTEDIRRTITYFQNTYSPEILAALDDTALLQSIFYTIGDNTNALCCWLEMNKECRNYFGSIAGGSAFKFGLFQKKETQTWTTGSPQKPQELSEEEAIELGKSIRDALVKGVEIIRNATLDSLASYENLDDDLRVGVGEQYYNWGWVHKYFSIICNDKLSGFHSTDWQVHVLRTLKIHPSQKYYARSGQLAMVENYAGWYYREFFSVIYDRFGDPRQFVRLGSSDDSKNYAAEWAKRSVVGIGWSGLGDFTEYVKGDGIDRKEIQEKLKAIYYPNDDKTASRKAGEITRFYKCDKNTIFVIMDGERLIAFADDVGAYFLDKTSDMSHLRPATWKFVFQSDEKMPEKSEGKMTTCYQLTDDANLQFLYEKYYYGEDLGNNLSISEESKSLTEADYKSLKYHTNYISEYDRNRIVFGAPGTGKSYKIKLDCESMLNDSDSDYERVTFHPDYTYSQFVGTYKPVTDNSGKIRYTFVPGPFMRIFIEALKNGRTDNPQPFVLIIEEINRAKVAAVFGDIFQLLDRDDDGVSEYDIHASEAVKNYMAEKLGGGPENYKKIRIPDNMFIWATMNSADQGVFPMDTAFKRRWNFEYLGINANEHEVRGSIMLGTDVTQDIEWNVLRKAINEKLAKEYKVNEDKLMGPFFLSKKTLKTVSDTDTTIADTDCFMDTFKSKVIMYLYEDAAKQHKHKLFSGCEDTTKYSAVCESFDRIGMKIFGEDFEVTYYNPQKG